MAKANKAKPNATCEGAPLKNVFLFKYLGSIFAADGDHKYDLRRRIGLAMSRCGALRHIFDSSIPMQLKLKLYKVAVTSLLTYDS